MKRQILDRAGLVRPTAPSLTGRLGTILSSEGLDDFEKVALGIFKERICEDPWRVGVRFAGDRHVATP